MRIVVTLLELAIIMAVRSCSTIPTQIVLCTFPPPRTINVNAGRDGVHIHAREPQTVCGSPGCSDASPGATFLHRFGIVMPMSALQEITASLAQLKPVLMTRYHVKSIGLFGSVVRPDFSEATSDVDVIVEFSEPIGIEFVDLAQFLESHIHRKIDVVSRQGIKPKYLRQLESEIVYV